MQHIQRPRETGNVSQVVAWSQPLVDWPCVTADRFQTRSSEHHTHSWHKSSGAHTAARRRRCLLRRLDTTNRRLRSVRTHLLWLFVWHCCSIKCHGGMWDTPGLLLLLWCVQQPSCCWLVVSAHSIATFAAKRRAVACGKLHLEWVHVRLCVAIL